MRYLLVLIAGCVPLAVLTVQSLQGWLALRGAAPGTAAYDPPPAAAALAALPADQPLRSAVAALESVDLASPAGVESESLGPLAGAWSDLRMTREFVAGLLDAELLGTQSQHADGAAEALNSLLKRYVAAPPRGTRKLIDLLPQRIEQLEAEARAQGQAEARAKLLAQARESFAAGRWSECLTACDRLLTDPAGGLAADDRGKLRVLRERAGFRADEEKLASELQRAAGPDREPLIRRFLEKYARRSDLTPSEQDTIERYRREAVEK